MNQLKFFRSSFGLTVLVVVLSVVVTSRAEGPKPSQGLDLTQIRGFNYTPSTARNDIEFWRDYNEAQVERELDFARRLHLNQTRIFLNYVVYEREREAFLERVRHFVRAAHERGIGTMIVVWDQCCVDEMPFYAAHEKKWYPNPGPKRLGQDFWPAGEKYAQDIVKTLSGEPGLDFWDIMNEPRVAQQEEVREFVKHFAKVFKALDAHTPITMGSAGLEDMAALGDAVDILSYHDYSSTRAGSLNMIQHASEISHRYNKPVMLTETACLGRANPYDMALEIYQKEHMGWYIWELMISQSQWGTIHGVVYPNGTVRDPSIAAALLGFFRNRGPDFIPTVLDQEGVVTRCVADLKKWQEENDPAWEKGLRLAEIAANLLEAGELVPMNDPPSRELKKLREGAPNLAALREIANKWSGILERYRQPCALARGNLGIASRSRSKRLVG
jgi:hypothetical protein